MGGVGPKGLGVYHSVFDEPDFVSEPRARFLGLRRAFEVEMSRCGVATTHEHDERILQYEQAATGQQPRAAQFCFENLCGCDPLAGAAPGGGEHAAPSSTFRDARHMGVDDGAPDAVGDRGMLTAAGASSRFSRPAPFLRSCLKRRWSEHCTGRACTVSFASAPEVKVFRLGSRLLPSSLIKAPPTATEVTCNAPGPSGFVPLSQQMQPVAGTAFDLPACLSIEALSPQMQPVASSAHVPPLPRHRWFGFGSSLSQPVHPCGSTALSEGRSGLGVVVTGTFSHPPACPTGVPGDLPDPQPLRQPGEPPALLGREGPPRPSAISKMGASAVAVLPEYLSRYPVNEIPVDQLGLFGLEAGHPRRLLRFSVFDRLRHHQHRTAAYEWSLQDLVTEAVRAAGERVKTVQVLTSHVPDLAVPQLVLTPADSAPGQLCVPLDLRPHGGRPCTLLLSPGTAAPDVIAAAFRQCPGVPLLTPDALDDFFLMDAQGQVWDELPADLGQLQWLRVQRTTEDEDMLEEVEFRPFGAPMYTVLESTAGTTTEVLGHEQVQQITLVLAGLGITVRLHPQLLGHMRVEDSLSDLVLALARQRRLPPRSRVVLAATQPHPLSIQHVTIVFTLYPEDDRRHILLDSSADGSMVQSMAVDARTRPEEMVASAQARQGYVAVVNGVTQAAVRRCLYHGDYVQVVQNPQGGAHRLALSDCAKPTALCAARGGSSLATRH